VAGEAGRLRRLALVVAALGCCAATGASSPVTELAGRYDRPYTIPEPGSAPDRFDDVVEIVPVSGNAAYFRAKFIGHDDYCEISGIAQIEKSRLIYRAAKKPADDDAACAMTIWRVGNSLHVRDGLTEDDIHAGCAHMYCGVGEDLSRDLPWSSKQAITYMTKLKASPEYRDALIEWRTGKPVNP
jgi:hypothetical protein